jgi:general secretion pathway protein D
MPPATAPPETPVGTTPAPAAAAPAAAARPTGPVRIQFPQDTLDKTVGQSFTVNVEVENAHDVVSAPFTFQYDPKLLSLDQVAYGNFWTSDGQEPQPLVKNVQNDAGMASIRVSRKAGSPALAGKGTLLTLTFKALASGTGTISASNITLNNIQDQMVGSGSPRLTVDIK